MVSSSGGAKIESGEDLEKSDIVDKRPIRPNTWSPWLCDMKTAL